MDLPDCWQEGAPRDKRPLPPRPSIPLSCVAACVAWLLIVVLFTALFAAGVLVPRTFDAPAGTYRFELLTDAQKNQYGYSASANLIAQDGAKHRVQIVYADGPLLRAHETVAAQATFSAFSEETALRYAEQGLVARARLTSVERVQTDGVLALVVEARQAAIAYFDEFEGQGAALLRALLLGDRSRLEDDGLYDCMKAAGLAHVVAVSGAHLSIVGALVASVLRALRVPRQAVACMLCVFYALYSLFTGMTAPVVRAAVMAGVVVLSVLRRRRSSPLAALGVCVCALLAVNPSLAFSLSFFLSVFSTAGIVVLSPLLSAWLSALFGGRAKGVCDAGALTIAANLPIFPVTACVFSRVALCSPLSNLIAGPLLTLFLAAGLPTLGLCVLAPAVGHACLAALCALAGAFCEIVRLISSMPCASIPFSMDFGVAVALSAACAIGLWAWWPRPHVRSARRAALAMVAAMLVAIVVPPLFQPDRIVVLDVGQGDAILIQSQGASLLVDTGEDEQTLLAALGRQHARSLDGVVISHHDSDHCGALPALAGMVDESAVFVAADTFACSCDGCTALLKSIAQLRLASPAGLLSLEGEGAGLGLGASGAADAGAGAFGLRVGDTIRVGRFVCEVVWPEAFVDEGGNADSVCLLVSYDADGDGEGESCVLLTGDAEAEQLSAMLDAGAVGQVDLVKAGHHGSKAGITDELARRLSPAAVLISVGADNSYGHPAPTTVASYESAGARVFRTDQQGDIQCTFSAGGIDIAVQKNAA